jgi:diaminohydroxyphosphoribosylaminopyrimidine deaminase/5-amino-6-(5-phosphoribosylamino)uracil reductase
MVRALELARHGLYSTPPNPAVGCVLVRWGQVVGEGFHQRAGEPHAEIMALHEAGIAARGATAYVTLEPCAHHGRTPPCADALIAAGIRRVVVAMRDPNPRVDGSGLGRLDAAGIKTAHGLLAGEAAEINRGFIRRMITGRPWVTLKLGASLDGRTALADGTSKWITGERARADVQRLRARSSAIITGSGTVLADDPMLTVRDPDLELRGRRPLRVVLDSSLNTPPTAQVLSFAGSTLVLTRNAASPLAEPLREVGAKVESVRGSRAVRSGSSATTVPLPVTTAEARARSRCTSARAGSPVIHLLVPFASAVRPSRLAPSLSVTHGRPRVMRLTKPRFSSAASSAMSPTVVGMPAASRRPRPPPSTAGFGSRMATTTRDTFAAMSASTQGGVRPWCEHGSSVT